MTLRRFWRLLIFKNKEKLNDNMLKRYLLSKMNILKLRKMNSGISFNLY